MKTLQESIIGRKGICYIQNENEMKNLDSYINESIELGPGMMTSLFLAACFCIPNGVSAIIQLIQNKGKRAAAKELINSLDANQKKSIEKLNKLDLEKYPQTKKLMNLIISGANEDSIMTQYWIVIHSGEIANRTVHKNIENITTDHLRNVRAHRDKKIKWAIEPSTFLSMVNFSKFFLRK